MVGDDARSDFAPRLAGLASVGASPGTASSVGVGDNPYPYHKGVKGKKDRPFRLLPLGTTPCTCKKPCKLCRRPRCHEDHLYEGYELEWAYYHPNGELEGEACFYSALTHRLRYKAYTRAELVKELLDNEESFQEFLDIESTVIDLKRRCMLDDDLSSVPVPQCVVEEQKRSELIICQPQNQVLTEEAFKRRNDGLSFKDAGLKPEEWEVDEGVFITGVLEQVGEAGVYPVQQRMVSGVSKRTVIDGGRPQIDENQGATNFKHLTKKQRLTTKAALEVIVAALAVAVAVAYTRYIVVVNIKSRPSRGSPSLT